MASTDGLTVGSLFSGIGGLELGCALGPVPWQAESDPYARAVLAKRFPGVHCYDDVRRIDRSAARPDVIMGGFPCQDLSLAGKGGGLTAERSGLWWEYRRIVRTLRPRYVFIENVHGGWRRWLPVVRRSLWRVGYASVPLRVRASEAGAHHERARVFVLAYADGQGELQPRGSVSQERRRAGDGGGWPAEPNVARVAHGVPLGLDRIRCLGNAVVPPQAALAWRTLWRYVNG